MPQTDKLNGTLVKLFIGAEPVAYATNVSFDLSAAEVDTTNKDSAGYRGVRPGLISGTAKVQGFTAFDTGSSEQGVKDLEALRSSRGVATLKIALGGTTGDKFISASARLTDLSMSAGVEDNLTFDASFKFTGTITWGTESGS